MNKILLIGPLFRAGSKSKIGGLSQYVSDMLNENFIYPIHHFNIARSIKSRMNNRYKSVLDAGLLRMLKGSIITLWHMFIYPYVLIQYNPNIVHIAATSNLVFWENSYYLIVSKIFKKKIFIHYLGSFDIFFYSSGKFKRYLIKYILKKSNIIGVLSSKVNKILSSFFDSSKIIILPSSIDYSLFENNCRTLKFPNNEYIKILFLGGWDAYKKGVTDVIKAIPHVLKKHKKVLFIITSYNKIDIDMNIESENIILLNWIPTEDKIPLYNSCDIFLLPSYDEGLPYSMIEAMAAGLPIIASNVGGIPEVVQDNENGFVINPGDINQMVSRINYLIENIETRIKMKKNNQIIVKKNYSLEHNIDIIKNIYNDLIEENI